MPTSGIKVLFCGRTWNVPYETQLCEKPTGIMMHIAKFMPDIIVTGNYIPGVLKTADFETRKKWLHSDNATDEQMINMIEGCYYHNIWTRHKYQDFNRLITVYTGTHNTGDNLRDTYQSLRDQTYKNWEWVVIDDESNDGTWDRLLDIAQEDHRVRPYRIKHNGKIGAIKDTATRLAYGEYVVEMDHDDMLTDNALDEVVKAFNENPDVGMVYTNCANFFSDGTPHMFQDPFWQVRYRDTEYNGKVYKECINPDIYDRFGPNHQQQFGWFLTVGPNHIRAYRLKTLMELGGYNRNIPVADDWDVYARFFLRSKCLHINKMLYLYRFHDAHSNTTFTRNKSIQDHLALGRANYNQEFIDFNMKRLNENKSVTPKATQAPKWSFVVVDWNTEGTTITCLKSIRQSYQDAEIILIENGKHFDNDIPNKIVKLEMNIGFGAACNRGALEATGDFICFINSDAMINSDVLPQFENCLNDPEVGIVGPYSNEAKLPQGNHSADDQRPAISIDVLSGFCFAMRRDLFATIGGFDTRFCNFEDDDLCNRIRQAGFKCMVANAWVFHKEHTSFKINNVNANIKIEESRIKYKSKWPKVKVITLTLNEKKALPGFFEQFKGITGDFAILDSGSTDGTAEWAKENGVKIEVRKFDRFDNQRNAAVNIFAGDAEWVVMFDPDERLDQNTIKYFSNLISNNTYDIFMSPLRSENYDGTFTEWVAKPFMFRNRKEIKWVNPVHEKLIGSHKQALIKNSMNTHHLSLHDPSRRTEMSNFYNSLGGDAELLDEWPILNYQHRDDDRIDKVFLGPLVSMIVPTYKRSSSGLVDKAIESIVGQDYLSKEIIVVGDCCPELGCTISPGSYPSVSKLLNHDIIIMNLQNNHGAGGAVPRNYGIMLASGELVGYLDDDNIIKKDHISSLVSAINGVDFAFSSLDIDGKTLLCDVPQKGKIDTSCLLHRKNLVQRFGWWRDRNAAGYAHDWEFVHPWVDAGVKWTATKLPTVIYNKDTSGQKEYLEKLMQ